MPYNNFYGFNPNFNNEITRLNREIEDRQNMIKQMQQSQTMQQAPVQNIINTNAPKTGLEAKIITDGQSARDIIVANRTVFLDEKNKKVSVKEEDGTISKEYEIVIPLTEEQKEIQELKRANNILTDKIKQMEGMINNGNEFTKSSKSIDNVEQSNNVNDGNNTTKSKKSSKSNNE